MMFPSIKVSNRNDIFVLVSLFVCFFCFFFALSTRFPSIHLRTKVKFLLLTKLNKERVVFLLFGPALLNVQSTSSCHNH